MQRRLLFRIVAPTLRILVLLAALLACSAASANGLWSGYWTTTWRDGGGRLLLEQQGDHVIGTYPLYGGRIEAVASGRRLDGKWFEGERSGGFVFVMDQDGQSFSGRYDTGEWWTGARSTSPASAAAPNL